MFEIIVNDDIPFRNFLSGGILKIGVASDQEGLKSLQKGCEISVLLDVPEFEPLPGVITQFHGPTEQVVDGEIVYLVSIKGI